jgi:hypothetical protein
MKQEPTIEQSGVIPADAVLLIPGPEQENEQPAHGVKPGYYNSKQMLFLLDKHKDDPNAVRFIADMLETGDEENDGFAKMLRKDCHDPLAIARIIRICRT